MSYTLKVFMALLQNGTCSRAEVLDACAPYDREEDVWKAFELLDLHNLALEYPGPSYALTKHGIRLATVAVERELVIAVPE